MRVIRTRPTFTRMLIASAFALTLSGLWGLAQACERMDAAHSAVTRTQRAMAAKAKMPVPSVSGPAILPARIDLPTRDVLAQLDGGAGLSPMAVLSLGGPSDRAPPA